MPGSMKPNRLLQIQRRIQRQIREQIQRRRQKRPPQKKKQAAATNSTANSTADSGTDSNATSKAPASKEKAGGRYKFNGESKNRFRPNIKDARLKSESRRPLHSQRQNI